MSEKRKHIQHYYTTVNGRKPAPENLYNGEIAINAAKGDETLFFKNNENQIVEFKPVGEIEKLVDKKIEKTKTSPEKNQIFYTSISGEIIDFTGDFNGVNIISNVYENNRGTILCNGDITTITPIFSYNKLLESIIIPDSVTWIENNAFRRCSGLTNVIIPDSVTGIGENVFTECTSLTSITIPDSVTYISVNTFRGCNKLKKVNIGYNVVNIVDSMFDTCDSLININIPKSVVKIGYNAFRDCLALTNINIPDSVRLIDAYAFRNCLALTNIVIPNSVTAIRANAFLDCDNLKKIYCKASVPPQISNGVFDNIEKIYVPYESLELYRETWNQYKDIIHSMVDTTILNKLNEVDVEYSELKLLRDNSELIPGMWYRITDYVTTTSQEDTQSANHQFDVLVLATSENTLSEEARAIRHDGDEYFSTSNLDAWKIWYSLDNDTERFYWTINRTEIRYNSSACSINSDLVNDNNFITPFKASYYVFNDDTIFENYTTPREETVNSEDLFYEFGYLQEPNGVSANLCIFKSNPDIYEDEGVDYQDMFFYRGVELFEDVEYDKWEKFELLSDGTVSVTNSFIYTNRIVTGDIIIEENEILGKGVIYRMIDENGNDCPYDFKNILFKNINDKFDHNWYYTFSWVNEDGNIEDLTIRQDLINDGNEIIGTKYNIIKPFNEDTNSQKLNRNIFISKYDYDGFFYGCYNNILGKNCYNNIFRNHSFNFTLGVNCASNTFGNDCHSNTFGDECCNNTLGNNCYRNTFGNNCTGNTFGDDCHSNTFGDSCSNNTFGDGCSSNTFGINFSDNTLGDGCGGNTFGNDCDTNTFGINFSDNTFGNDCHSNTFGDNCYKNTFGDNCYKNTFGEECSNNTFGNGCINNTFGNNSYSNTLGIYCDSNTFGNGCNDNTVGGNCTDNTFGYNSLLNALGNYCSNNTLGDGCHSNTFGDNCYDNNIDVECEHNIFGHLCQSNFIQQVCSNNKFAKGCERNTLGEGCNNNIFGFECCDNVFSGGCEYNVFGNHSCNTSFDSNCSFNTLGNNCGGDGNIVFSSDCYNNTMGDYCNSIVLGEGCNFNKFGSGCGDDGEITLNYRCVSNTFSDDCDNIVLGEECSNNTFGTDCRVITFGDYCSYNNFGIACQKNTFDSYFSYNTIEDKCSFNYIKTNLTVDVNNILKNLHIHSGFGGSDRNIKETVINKLNSVIDIDIYQDENGNTCINQVNCGTF